MQYVPAHLMQVQSYIDLGDYPTPEEGVVITIAQRGLFSSPSQSIRIAKKDLPGLIAALQDTLEKL